MSRVVTSVAAIVLLWSVFFATVPAQAEQALSAGDPAKGRLVFAQCRACHATAAADGHHNGPNLHRIFGKVVGQQPGFDHYSTVFRNSQFVWTPELMFAWLENPMERFPGSSMMSLGVPDAQQRADLIAYLKQASVR